MTGATDRSQQDAKLQKLAAKIEGNPKLGGGQSVLVAVPAKRGGLGSAALGAVSGNVRNVQRHQRSARADVQGEAAKRVHKQMGDGSDFVLCLTGEQLRIIRFIAFGMMSGPPTVLANTDVAMLATDLEGKSNVGVVFHDDSILPFQVSKAAHVAALAAAAEQVWPTA